MNLYFLWAVERVGMVCNLKTIGGRDWYRWGAGLLIPAQQRDGHWIGRGNTGSPVIDTSIALLFLRRSDLLPDLRQTLQKRLKITDPAVQPKADSPQQTPDDKTNPKSVPDKKDPSDKTDAKAKDEPDAGVLKVDLGEVKAKETATKPFKVRGPAAFSITGWRGSDAQLKIEAASKGRDVHEVTLRLQPDQAGDFTRTIYLYTDVPGRAEVAVRIQARVTAAP